MSDALRVYELQAGALDEAYLDNWAVLVDVAGRSGGDPQVG